MKNQTDMIVAIVAFVLTAGSLLGMWFMKREPAVLTAPTEVTTTPAQMPAGDVVLANSLPGGGNSSMMGGRGGMGGPGMMGGMMGGPGMMGGGPGMMGGGKPGFGAGAPGGKQMPGAPAAASMK